MLIKALAELLSSGYSNIHITFVGSDAGELHSCKQLSQKLGVSHLISFEGFKDNIDDFYKKADILVHCSYVEGLPLVLLEAMRSGMPVIFTGVGGVLEVVDNGVTGFIVNVNDHLDLIDKIIFFMKNRMEVKKQGLAARRLYERSFSSVTMIDSYKKTLGFYG